MVTVLAVDPGRAKCGVAVVRRPPDAPPALFDVPYRAVISTDDLPTALTALVSEYSPEAIVVGNGTTHASALRAARQSGCARVEVVDEEDTTLEARKRYFRENPPRGLRRLIPSSLQTPPRPYDDCVAVILAERYLLR